MSWTLSASGHADDAEQEKSLAAHIGHLLAGAGSVVSFASFGGSAYSGDPRDLAPVAGPDDLAPEVTE